MSTAKVLRRGMAVLTLLGLILAAGWYRAFPDTETGSALVPLSAKAMQSRIAELAACPSPLERLGIDRPRPRLMVGEDEIDLVIPATGDEDGSMVRFTLDPRSDGSHTRVRWHVRLADGATELDLGEDRLLNPVVLARELDAVVKNHVDYYAYIARPDAPPVTGSQRSDQARNCRKAGRIIDAVAVVTNPALSRTIERQRRREALNWLFKDEYRLRTDSQPGAYWETNADYPAYVD